VSRREARRRYIAFRVSGPRAFTRDEILSAIHSLDGALWLVSFRDSKGLVRSTNVEKEGTIRSLNALRAIAGESVEVSTLGTSGTIRAAVRKYLQ
jgi:RNase P/RNase MRP subunit POP5